MDTGEDLLLLIKNLTERVEKLEKRNNINQNIVKEIIKPKKEIVIPENPMQLQHIFNDKLYTEFEYGQENDVYMETSEEELKLGHFPYKINYSEYERQLKLASANNMITAKGKSVVNPKLENYILKAFKIHNNLIGRKSNFDYSKVVYDTLLKKIEVICRRHQISKLFTAAAHVDSTSPASCSKCAIKFNIVEDYYKPACQAFENHGRYLDFTDSLYLTSKQNITVRCINHDEKFEIRADQLKKGITYCTTCVELKTMTTEKFIEKAKIKHGNKFLYDKINFVNTKTFIIINCLIENHGEFTQLPNDFLNSKYACPKCQIIGVRGIKL